MTSADRPLAFVIMPFASEFDAVFRNLISPALAGYEVRRADTRLDERSILEKIVTGIRDADLVVADITNTNANVMYELGVAHSFGKPTIMVAQSVENLPFDIKTYPVHQYPEDLGLAQSISAHLLQLAERYREGLVEFANPVLDFAPTYASALPMPFSASKAYSIGDFLDDIETSTTLIGSFPSRLNNVADMYARRLRDATPKLRRIGPTVLPYFDDPGVLEAADCTRAFASDLSTLGKQVHDAWERFGRAMMWALAPEQLAQAPPEFLESSVSSANKMDGLLNITLGNLAELRLASEFPNYSGNLTHAFSVARDAITGLLNEIMTAKGYVARIRSAFPEST